MAEKTDLIVMGEGWFKKAPALSTNARETLVRITPVLSLVFGILGILAGLSGLGILSVLSPFAIATGVHGYGVAMIVALLFVVSSVMMLMAYPGTKARQFRGWKLLFWAEVVNLVGNVVTLNLVGVILQVVAFYLLYQIKSYYK